MTQLRTRQQNLLKTKTTYIRDYNKAKAYL